MALTPARFASASISGGFRPCAPSPRHVRGEWPDSHSAREWPASSCRDFRIRSTSSCTALSRAGAIRCTGVSFTRGTGGCAEIPFAPWPSHMSDTNEMVLAKTCVVFEVCMGYPSPLRSFCKSHHRPLSFLARARRSSVPRRPPSVWRLDFLTALSKITVLTDTERGTHAWQEAARRASG